MRVTLKQIAAQTGFHHSTVSRALRGDRALPEETRARIRQAAEKLGYRPDPYLAGLIAHRSARRSRRFRAVLGWLNNWPERAGWRRWVVFRQVFLGAQKRADALGYRLEDFWLAAPSLSPARAAHVLQTRQINGLIVAPQPEPQGIGDFDFARFAAVAIGQTLRAPALHSVTSDHYHNMVLLVRALQGQGFRRIGYVTTASGEARTNGHWSSGFAWAITDGGRVAPPIPPLTIANDDTAPLGAWYRRHRPDVIASTCPVATLRRLREMGLRVPHDVSLACAALNDDARFVAGISEHPELIGAAAVDMVVELLHKDERGIPAVPRRLTIPGSWTEGPSVRGPQLSGARVGAA
ncbi:MAG TPA: LacI family DNA-binding transcriptional regulator [Opitutaceae bacterium]|nr:LacI family DNA-binding transcriptional regulator [Opitutaceae bacterium]